ncbi:MAG: hypothetical protein GXP47_10340 [Acidobacteria bacterium]|nr:hypothetical protein [Acidobacteriota bacterium]
MRCALRALVPVTAGAATRPGVRAHLLQGHAVVQRLTADLAGQGIQDIPPTAWQDT